MIPIKLKIQGFLTFKSPVEINFEELSDDGIFLISGPTGSGKTSIFDAISYALYGIATTSGRNSAKDLRSHLIDMNEDLLVEFKFRAGRREYEIRRWQKGQGDTKQRLVIDGDETQALTKVTDIKNAITDALGLTADQFCKIVMLPQGEFRNFLVASSKDKSDILRKLFDTEHYARIRFMISDKLKNIFVQVSEAQTIIDTEKKVSEAAAGSLSPGEIKDIITHELEDVRNKRADRQEEIRKMGLVLDNLKLRLEAGIGQNKDLDERDQLKQHVEAAQAEEIHYREVEKKADQLNRIRPLSEFNKSRLTNISNLERKQNLLREAERSLEAKETELKEAELNLSRNPERRLRLTSISKETDKIAETAKAVSELSLALSREQTEAEQTRQLALKIDQRKTAETNKAELIEKNQQYSAQILKLTQNNSRLREDYAALKDKIRDIQDYCELKASAQTKTRGIEEARRLAGEFTAREIEKRAELDRLKSQYEKQGLAKYTHLLASGEPCPLCGSPDHPSPYHEAADVTSAQVKQCEKELADLQKQINSQESSAVHLSRELGELLSKQSAAEAKLNYQTESAGDLDELNHRLNNIEQEGKEGAAELKEIEKEQKKTDADCAQLDKLLNSLKNIQSEYELHRDELTKVRQVIDNLKSQIQGEDAQGLERRLEVLNREKHDLELTIKNSESDHQSVQREVTQLTTRIGNTTEDIRELTLSIAEQEAYLTEELAKLDLSRDEFQLLEKELPSEASLRKEAKEFFSELAKAQARFQLIRNKLEGKTRVDLEQLKLDKKAAEESQKVSEQDHVHLIRRESQLDTALKHICAAAQLYEKYSRELEIARKLDSTTGKGTTFENYVLGYYLDGVLMNANVRLKAMTNKRFTLIRQAIDTDGKRSIEGLDINVFDTYSNTERDVKTLSGGESFKASLAMALGLSDFIQENKSGIRLDTIFIDEGFGTLDQESLDAAMETILEIQDMGRLVGIISHVEELKERIPTQIVVENKGAEGSFVRIVKH